MKFEKDYTYLVEDKFAYLDGRPARVPLEVLEISPNGKFAKVVIGFYSDTMVRWVDVETDNYIQLDILHQPMVSPR